MPASSPSATAEPTALMLSRSLPVRVTDDAAEAATTPEADAVAIVTDASTHRRLAGMALEAGKHVLVEKPSRRRARMQAS